MHRIYTAPEASETDAFTIRNVGIPSLVLMERASLGVTKRVMDVLAGEKGYGTLHLRPVICVCGKGNNGGDGLCVARQLKEWGVNVSVFLAWSKAEQENVSFPPADKTQRRHSDDKTGKSSLPSDFDTQLEICRRVGIRFADRLTIPKDAVIVDAVFGNGLDREVGGAYRDVIKKINASGAYVISVDLPSGINATTGRVMGIAVNADETVTFGAERLGHILYPGAAHTGKLTVENIGWQMPDELEDGMGYYLTDSDDLDLIPARSDDSHKGTFGNVLIIAGSKEYGGAAALSCTSAYMTGSGMVRLYTHEDNRTAVLASRPETVVTEYDKGDFKTENETETLEKLKELLKKADSVVMGPGMGKSEISAKIVRYVIENVTCPLIIDADALNLIAEDTAIFKPRKISDMTITPHLKEAAILLGISVDEAGEDLIKTCLNLHEKYKVNVILKGAVTVMTDGKSVFINSGANSGMACAGSGDVLSGILGSLAGFGLKKDELMRAGVFLHAEAGRLAKEKKGAAGMLPMDVAGAVGDVLKSTLR